MYHLRFLSPPGFPKRRSGCFVRGGSQIAFLVAESGSGAFDVLLVTLLGVAGGGVVVLLALCGTAVGRGRIVSCSFGFEEG